MGADSGLAASSGQPRIEDMEGPRVWMADTGRIRADSTVPKRFCSLSKSHALRIESAPMLVSAWTIQRKLNMYGGKSAYLINAAFKIGQVSVRVLQSFQTHRS